MLIPSLEEWYNRKHGSTDYRLTQLLSGHGCFEAFLHMFGRRLSPRCIHCEDGNDDIAEHTFFHCKRWEEERTSVERVIGPLTKDNLVKKALESDDNWELIRNLAKVILKAKEERERENERLALLPRPDG